MANVRHDGPAKDPPVPVANGKPVLVLTRSFGLPPGSKPVLEMYVGRHRLKPSA